MGKGNKARTVLQRLITYTISTVRVLAQALCMFVCASVHDTVPLPTVPLILTKVQQVTNSEPHFKVPQLR